ncbi:MAG TPA: undecaprenyldiphospho-muramoylpentapeptide beta-N-acetylglucosaminyltransferase [Xanthobacteraceae bacterium]|nr:undecaprenyldiphospho-muramoylpentapeptide beta-N-acetylglucosaminyltransferase [Xanthobacteraceae bacterium]
MSAGTPLVLLAAGGTGGHLFPAEALANALARRGIAVDLATDRRAAGYAGKFPARRIHVLPSDTLRSRNPLRLALTLLVLGYGILRAVLLLLWLRPAAVVGFGGYPTLPPVLAAWLLRIPRIVHEQNAVLGRANRLLAARASAIATGYPGILAQKAALAIKAVHTGNPVRAAVREAAAHAYEEPAAEKPFRLLVFGGSQGARIMSEIVPGAIERSAAPLRARIRVVQQCRAEDIGEVKAIYARLGVPAELAVFFNDMPERIAASHLVIARSGASTVAELAAIGRPSILVPLPHALDQDQLANATVLVAAGGALLIRQDGLSAERLAQELSQLAEKPAMLAGMAAAARAAGRVDAAERLADLVMRVAGIEQMRQNKAA